MDLNSIKDQVSNLTLYDLKAGVRKVQNAVMNYTEMEAKVREATNNEPWGASSTQLQEIANATHSYHLLNEIMPMIYKRFTEKAAEEWRQIYKALQLLEFLIKNGSERVIDDARSHLSLLKMLRQFHHIDQNGKDQGINVRNRSKELAELLSDVERIRSERKKARSNRNKFGGVEGGAMSSGGGSRYGGFGSEEPAGYGSYSGGVYGDGGGFGGNESGFQDSQSRRDRFEEYDEADDNATSTPARRKPGISTTSAARPKKQEPVKPKEPEIDLLEDIPPETPPKEFGASFKAPTDNGFSSLQTSTTATTDDDEFDDFQSATPVHTSTTASSVQSLPPLMSAGNPQLAPPRPMAPAPTSSGFNSISPAPPSARSMVSPPAPNYNINMNAPTAMKSPPPQVSATSMPKSQQQQQRPANYQPAQPNYFTSVPAPSTTSSTTGIVSPTGRPSLSSQSSLSKPAAKSSAAGGGDAFGSLWSTASAGAGIKKAAAPGQGPNLAALQKEKSEKGIWGMGAQPQQATKMTPSAAASMGAGTGMDMGMGMGGNMNGSNGQHSSTGGAMDDLLG